MARRRGRFSERILEKAPRKGRKKVSKKKTPKVAAKPKVREDIQIDIPEIINIPGIGQIEIPKAKPKPKTKAKAKPKPKPKAKAKVKARPKPKPRPVKLPDALQEDILREDIRIAPGTLAGLIGGAGAAKEKPKPKKEVKTPKKGKVREREDIRVNVPTREDIDKIIKDLDIKIPRVIDIPGAGQVTIPSVPAVASAVPSAPKEKPTLSGVIGGIKKIEEAVKEVKPVDVSDPEVKQALEVIKESKDVAPTMSVGREPAPDLPPAPPVPVRVDTTPQPTPPPEPMPPMPPPLVTVDAFRGFKDSYRPANIVGQSFDPSVRDDYEKQMQAARATMMQPGGNIRATEYPTYQTPTLAVPQTQFGGYGQPMPVAPLLPYAGLASATMPEQITQQRPPASGARVNPGTGKIEPVGIAPDPRLLNLPPGVSGPIR